MRSTSRVYFSRLDHLRFLAALMVLLWHSVHYDNVVAPSLVPRVFLASLWEEGHTGVALFLTLSGFLFASLTYDKDVHYGLFIRSRLLRILPLFVVWTLAAFYTSSVPPERLFATVFGLLDRNTYPHAGWTVLVEFQLYLVFPFLLAFSRRYGLKYLVGVVAVCGVIRLSSWLYVGTSQFMGYWTVFGRADQFVLGMLAFHASRRFGKLLGNPLTFAGGFLALSLAYHRFNQLGGYYGFGGNSAASSLWVYMPSLEGLGHGFVIASYLNLRLPIPKLLDRFLAWLGTLSYSLYLNHPFLVAACFKVAANNGVVLTNTRQYTLFSLLVVLPVLIAVSALTYYVIEVPFLSLRLPYATARSPAEGVVPRSSRGIAPAVGRVQLGI